MSSDCLTFLSVQRHASLNTYKVMPLSQGLPRCSCAAVTMSRCFAVGYCTVHEPASKGKTKLFLPSTNPHVGARETEGCAGRRSHVVCMAESHRPKRPTFSTPSPSSGRSKPAEPLREPDARTGGTAVEEGEAASQRVPKPNNLRSVANATNSIASSSVSPSQGQGSGLQGAVSSYMGNKNVSRDEKAMMDIPVSQQLFAVASAAREGLFLRATCSKNVEEVKQYFRSIGIGADVILWAQDNIPELFDLDVKTEVKPGYRSLFELKHPPTSVLSQLKTIVALTYLRSINVGEDVTTNLAGGNVSDLADNIQDHVKPLVELVRDAGMDEKHVVKAWASIPEFFSTEYLTKLHTKLEFLKELGLDSAMCVGLMMAQQDGISDLQRLVDYMNIELGLQDKDVVRVLRSYPTLTMQSLDNGVKPVVDYLKSCGLRRSQMAQLVEEFPSVLACRVEVLDEMYKFLYGILADDDLVLRALMCRGEVTQDGGLSRLKGLLSTYESFINKGMTAEGVKTMTIRYPEFWNCDLRRKSVSIKLQYWCEELDFSAQDLLGVPEYLSYSLEEDIGPRIAFARSCGVAISLSSLPYLLAMSQSSFAESVCRKTAEEFDIFKKSWQQSKEGRKWHLLSDDIPGSGGKSSFLGGDGMPAQSPTQSTPTTPTKQTTPNEDGIWRRPASSVEGVSSASSMRSPVGRGSQRKSMTPLTGDGM